LLPVSGINFDELSYRKEFLTAVAVPNCNVPRVPPEE
jgi:hypothetical protein